LAKQNLEVIREKSHRTGESLLGLAAAPGTGWNHSFWDCGGHYSGQGTASLLFRDGAFTRSSLQHDIGAALVAGFFAVRAFYMLPSRTQNTRADDQPPILPATK